MTTISNLPSDLAKEILSRIPLKSLRQVRFTCKKWNSLTKSRSFAKLHISKAATTTREGESQMMAMMMNNNLHLTSVVNGTGVDDPYLEDKGMLTFTHLNPSDKVDIAEVFHCDGLLLFVLEDDLRLVVWNPYWGQPRWIEPRYPYNTRYRSYPALDSHDKYKYAFGYVNKNKSCCSHKILRFRDGLKKFVSCEIYDLDSSFWRILNITPHRHVHYAFSISVKGNTYWCAQKRDAYGDLTDYIICFDFTSERFGPLLPVPYSAEDVESGDVELMNLSCVREEKFAALFKHYETRKIEIWITTKIEAKKMSWNKFLAVDTGPVIEDFKIWNTLGSFFIDEEMKVAMVFRTYRCDKISIIGEAGYFREANLGEAKDKWYSPSRCSYVPSLAQIKERVDGKRKNQSDLEKHRYEKKMLRLEILGIVSHIVSEPDLIHSWSNHRQSRPKHGAVDPCPNISRLMAKTHHFEGAIRDSIPHRKLEEIITNI